MLSNFIHNLKLKKAARDKPSLQIHHCGDHWVCSRYDGNGGVYLYDSKYRGRTSKYLDTQLALLYADSSQQLKVTVPSIQKQEGDSECGLYALAVVTAIAAGINPVTQAWNQDLMREHCLQCIDDEYVTPFPINTTRGILPESHHFTIDLSIV